MWGKLRGTTVNHQRNIVCALLHQRKQKPIFYCGDSLCFLKGKKTKANQGGEKKALKNYICCRNKACSTFHSFFSPKENVLVVWFFQYVPAELSKGSTEVKDATVVSRRICTFVSKCTDQNQRISHNLILSQHWKQTNVLP